MLAKKWDLERSAAEVIYDEEADFLKLALLNKSHRVGH